MGCSEIADRVGAQRVFLVGTLASAMMAGLFAIFARDYWSGLVLYTLLALALGGTYTTGVLLVAENVPVARRGRAMGFFLAGHSLGLALALALTGIAVSRGGYPARVRPDRDGAHRGRRARVVGGARHPERGHAPGRGRALRGAVLRNRPAMLVIAGYTFHSWELLGMWAGPPRSWPPASWRPAPPSIAGPASAPT